MKPTLWTRNFTLIITATILGAMGSVAVSFALSFVVFDETGSTLAAGLLFAIQLIPYTILPLVIAPFLDRRPRLPVLVTCDAAAGCLYLIMAFFFWRMKFSYPGYLVMSLVISCLGAFDSLTYNSLYPRLIPEGMSQKGYSISSMIYPTLIVLITPISGWLYDAVGIAVLCAAQGVLALLAAFTESHIRLEEIPKTEYEPFSWKLWKRDMLEAAAFLRKEKGLQNIYAYMSVTSGAANGYSPLLVAFFRTTPGFTTVMYSAFTVAEFLGRTIGGFFHYHVKIPAKRRFSFAFFVYMVYNLMDMILLWIGYPFMLVNRAVCGFLGVNSASLREASVQNHIPDAMRAKLAAFSDVMYSVCAAVMSLVMGALGEVLDYRLCLTVSAAFTMLVLMLTVWRGRRQVEAVYNHDY